EVEEIKSLIGKRYAERAAIFDLENDAALFYFEALQRANKKLVGLNLDLERNNDHLGRSNRIFSAISETGLQLACAQDAAEVLDIAATILIRRLDVREGFIYRIDGANRVIEARFWPDPDNVSDVRCRLDNDMAPIFKEKNGVPKEIRPLIADYLSRAPSMPPARGDVSHLTFMAPFFIAPMIADGAFLGEILFRLEFKYGDRLLPQEYSGYSQLANLAAASLNRLDLHLQLEERAEGLGEALRKIRKINRKLLQAERLAAVGQLAAGAAHEINNPLAIIYARAQLLELKEDDAKKKKNFRQMIEQIERITSILNNLMDFARPAAPRFEPVSLSQILEKSLSLVQGSLKKLNIKVKKRLETDLPPVMGDSHQLEQVFLNLFINAEHAMEETGGVLTVSTRINAKQNREFVTVADNGVGIPKKHLEKIFDPFFTTKEEGKGTGLGMSTSYGIVTSHQGEIRVSSEKGVGTKVTVELPVDQTSVTQAKAASKRTPKKVSPKENAVLVVDDEKHIRQILKETLSANGYTVETAVNGQEGLAKLSQGKYRLLLLDIRMPWVNGLSLLSRIKHLVEEMPVIVLTGLAGPEEVEEALAMGASKCVRKPFQIEELLRDIHEILEKKDAS
ncbi:MAG: response regulator, partial [Thermodesulfobacteriota bacterium]|nr:response regulator [Thermodesulfobacteriota bacterium]